MMNKIKGVILIGVGRNLNRAVRTCYSFGVYEVYCLQCSGTVKNNLFSAREQVQIHKIESLEELSPENILALEVTKKLPALWNIPTNNIKYVAVGGETVTLRQNNFLQMARIPTQNNLCLTTEAALSIALYELCCRRKV